jgi:hypothetical protein
MIWQRVLEASQVRMTGSYDPPNIVAAFPSSFQKKGGVITLVKLIKS